jgi:hypothetical protein
MRNIFFYDATALMRAIMLNWCPLMRNIIDATALMRVIMLNEYDQMMQ